MLTTFGAVLLARFGRLLDSLEFRAYDVFINWQPKAQTNLDVAIIEITEANIQDNALRLDYPIWDDKLAELIEIVEAPERAPALQTQVVSAEYRAVVGSPLSPAQMDARITALLAALEVRRTRRGKEYDLHPLIETLARIDSDEREHVLVMRLAAREGATGRPEEVVAALGHSPSEATYHRLRLFFAESKPGVTPET